MKGLWQQIGNRRPEREETQYDKHGRFPSWADAMEHCDPEVKEVWTKALEAKGVKVERKPEIDTLDIQISQEAVDT